MRSRSPARESTLSAPAQVMTCLWTWALRCSSDSTQFFYNRGEGELIALALGLGTRRRRLYVGYDRQCGKRRPRAQSRNCKQEGGPTLRRRTPSKCSRPTERGPEHQRQKRSSTPIGFLPASTSLEEAGEAEGEFDGQIIDAYETARALEAHRMGRPLRPTRRGKGRCAPTDRGC